MSLGTLTLGTNEYLDIGNGKYINSLTTYGGARDELKVSPGRIVRPNKTAVPQAVCSLTRTKEFDIPSVSTDPDSTLIRRRLVVGITITAEPGIAASDIDAVLDPVTEWLDASVINLVMSGAS